MKRSTLASALFAGLLWAAPWHQPAHASRVAEGLSGTVTATPAGSYITIDGKTYNVMQTLQNDSTLLDLKVGDHVEVYFNGAASAKDARILSITVKHPAGKN
ncbi:MAG: hypothetical protein ISP90_06290 [Nevskia sp.]|nr:hypothetical protein [Nevskia sp.]